MQRSIKGWTVTTNGPLPPHPYFIRLSKTGDPNAAITYNVGNGGPTLDQRAVIDAGFLELVRLGELPATDPDVVAIAADRGRDDQDRRRRAGRAGTATTATATATARATAARGRRAGRGPATCGRCCPPSAPSRPSHRAMPPAPPAAARACAPSRPVSGSIPEQDWEIAARRRIAVRHRPDRRLDRLPERPCGRLGLAADLVGGLVRAADGRPRRQAQRRAAGRHARSATSPTRRARRR